MPAARKPLGIGRYNAEGNPCSDFHMNGVKHSPPGLEFAGIIDTGFTGFVQLPLADAFSLGLPLEGTISVTLADSSQQVCLTALARVTLLGKTEVGTVILSPGSSEVLVGMDFLRRFNRALVVSRGAIFVMDESFLSDLRG